MLEIPEAAALAKQINTYLVGRKIVHAMADASPHKFAWYHGDPAEYDALLKGKRIEKAAAWGGLVEIEAEDAMILLGDGTNIRFFGAAESKPQKHQLLVEFDDGSALCASVQMYGGIWCFAKDTFKNPYYLIAKEKTSPLSDSFDREYFISMITAPEVQKLSVKAFLATEQRMPGLGNGVLQDILWYAELHPKRKINTLSAEEKDYLFEQLKKVLNRMTALGGRDTEKDLHGQTGGYRTVMSRNNIDAPCPRCGDFIVKENYLGGSIYYCPTCQKH